MENKLYLVQYDGRRSYGDYFDAFVICCPSEEEARKTHPKGGPVTGKKDDLFTCWATVEYLNELKITELGLANNDIKKGVLIANYISFIPEEE